MSLITVENLSFRYPGGQKALRDISLSIDAGEKVAIVGANGAGKSTLLYHFNGTLAQSASVRIGDLPVIQKNLTTIRRQVGMVFQNPDDQLFLHSIFEDVAFGLRNMGISGEDIPALISSTLKTVGLEGYEERSAATLSVGEKKRAALATVLAMSPSVLCLDEPVAALDPRGRRKLKRLLKTLPMTMVIISHDLGIVSSLCSRVFILHRGTLAAQGDPEILLKDRDLLSKVGLY
ncbi:energy-coupling factor ABC transporter ATP-binding protein [Myxococcota bacterium]|nr:energy-coupling factor ABC transporter ATP-binding protein [Myxococcota bacterium]MBU1534119.1 energy-coupling factor ABC transporter ATP-binding protein [Myxococcota bacterium]